MPRALCVRSCGTVGANVSGPAIPRAADPSYASSKGRELVNARTILTVTFLIAFTITPILAAAPAAQAATVACGTTQCAAPVACNTSAGACWQPALASRWQYQLQAQRTSSGTCNTSQNPGGINVNITGTAYTGGTVAPMVFDIDPQIDTICDTSPPQYTQNTLAVSQIHAKGDKAIAYIDAGTWESFRKDAAQFDAFNNSSPCNGCLYGKTLSGFHNEKWLNISPGVMGVNPNTGQLEDRQAVILDEMTARVNQAKADGFDGIEFDNVDAWQNNTGLRLTSDQELQYITQLANIANSAGLTVALKNDTDQICAQGSGSTCGGLTRWFDYTVNEQCQQYSECSKLDPFVTSGKAAFQVEYKLSTGKFCPQANAANRNAILKTYDLFDTPWTPCR